jgi:deazaflavin-dependent oxidoreductase (nitroreductase family)
MVFAWLFKLFMRLQISVFRRTNGKQMAYMRGMPVLLLTTIGRKTRQQRTTPLMYVRDGDNYVIAASNNGRDSHPGWFHNLQASPQVYIEVPGKRLQAIASVATTAERERLWPQLVAQAPFFDDYQKGTAPPIPMVLLRPKGS